MKNQKSVKVVAIFSGLMALSIGYVISTAAEEAPSATLTFPQGAATASEMCGGCHVSVYREFSMGFGSDTKYQKMVLISPKESPLTLPASVSVSSSAHAFAGIDPFPIHAREAEMGGASCNVCHFPEAFDIPDIESPDIPKPKGRACTFTRSGSPAGRHSRPPFLKLPTFSFFLASTLTTGWPAAWRAAACSLI